MESINSTAIRGYDHGGYGHQADFTVHNVIIHLTQLDVWSTLILVGFALSAVAVMAVLIFIVKRKRWRRVVDRIMMMICLSDLTYAIFGTLLMKHWYLVKDGNFAWATFALAGGGFIGAQLWTVALIVYVGRAVKMNSYTAPLTVRGEILQFIAIFLLSFTGPMIDVAVGLTSTSSWSSMIALLCQLVGVALSLMVTLIWGLCVAYTVKTTAVRTASRLKRICVLGVILWSVATIAAVGGLVGILTMRTTPESSWSRKENFTRLIEVTFISLLFTVSYHGVVNGMLFFVNRQCIRNELSRRKTQDALRSPNMSNRPTSPGSTPRSNTMYLRRFPTLLEYCEVELGKSIGVGAFGTVYQGKWRGIAVAVKQCHGFLRDAYGSTEVDEQVRKEANAMNALRHPNIVLFLGAAITQEEGNLVIISEYCANGSLFDILHSKDQRRTLSWKAKRRLALGACRGLLYLHSAHPPLVHRDLKSANILVDEGLNGKLTDFGTLRVLNAATTARNSQKQPGKAGGNPTMSTAVGTTRWTAPEILRGQVGAGDSAEYSESVDIYSFGMVLYELAAEELPFAELGSNIEVWEAVTSGKRPVVQKGKCNEAWHSLIKSCWMEDPGLRPTASQVVKKLEEMVTEEDEHNWRFSEISMFNVRPDSSQHTMDDVEQGTYFISNRSSSGSTPQSSVRETAYFSFVGSVWNYRRSMASKNDAGTMRFSKFSSSVLMTSTHKEEEHHVYRSSEDLEPTSTLWARWKKLWRPH